MKKKSKLNNTHIFFKSSNSNVFHFKKDIETVQKLNFLYIDSEPSNLKKNNRINKDKPITINLKNMNNNCLNTLDNSNEDKDNSEDNYERYEKDLIDFSLSLKKLKTFYPNITDFNELENYNGVTAPTRVEHIKFETNLKEQILSFDKEIKEIKNERLNLETEIMNIDKKIMDQKLNMEVMTEIQKESNNKVIKEKLLLKFEKEIINEDNNLNKKNKIIHNVKDFQEQFDKFVKKEEFNNKLKKAQIEQDITNNKNLKKKLIQKLNLITEKLKKFHKKKNIIVQKLYNHYLNILHEGKDSRSEGLCWIIREIFSLEKRVLMSYMPEFLDKFCIKYLFDITHLNIEITEIEKKIKSSKEIFEDLGIINKEKNFLNRESLIQTNKSNKNTKNNKYSDEKNETMFENLKKIKQDFNSPKLEPNLKINNSQTYIHKKSINENNNDNKILPYNKKKLSFIFPFINGNNPNSLSKSLSKEIRYINKFSRDIINIPNVLKVKDMEKMTKNAGYFLKGEKVKKINFYFSLIKKLNNLRKKKETMKFNEMTRIFKEFQRNNYEQRFNIDKKSVISALIGEDNVNSELIKQSRREKKYMEEILKGTMHKINLNSNKSYSVRNIFGGSYFGLNKINNMTGFEKMKNNEEYSKRFNSLGNN